MIQGIIFTKDEIQKIIEDYLPIWLQKNAVSGLGFAKSIPSALRVYSTNELENKGLYLVFLGPTKVNDGKSRFQLLITVTINTDGLIEILKEKLKTEGKVFGTLQKTTEGLCLVGYSESKS